MIEKQKLKNFTSELFYQMLPIKLKQGRTVADCQ